MKNKFLPIGTIVLLKGGKKELMITGYCICPNSLKQMSVDKNDIQQIFDYGACTYPEGFLDDSITYAFNHEQIKEILFLGYETPKQKEFSRLLNVGMFKFKENQKNN